MVGGVDTADLERRTGNEDEMSFIFADSAASLEFIEGKILLGVN
jgi:3-phosphoglycerate kinase